MAAETGNETRAKQTLKLLVDKKRNVVLFAEAGKEVVDFIFHLLALPIGTVVQILSKDAMVGALGNLYGCVETLNATYRQCSDMDVLLKPKIPRYDGGSSETLLLPAANSTANSTTTYYRCSANRDTNCEDYVTLTAGQACPHCRSAMTSKLKIVETQAAASSGGGYVKGVVTYMVMDNLVVKPMSTISSITLLNKYNVVDLTDLEEKTVDFGFAEGVKLLKASMESTNVLTNVFLAGKEKVAEARVGLAAS